MGAQSPGDVEEDPVLGVYYAFTLVHDLMA